MICFSVLLRNWLNWNCIGLFSIRMLMVFVSVFSDLRCFFCILILIKNVIVVRLMQSNSMFCCVVGMIIRKYKVFNGNVVRVLQRKFIVIICGFGRCIVSVVIMVIIIIVLLFEVQFVYSQNSVLRIQEIEVCQKFIIV